MVKINCSGCRAGATIGSVIATGGAGMVISTKSTHVVVGAANTGNMPSRVRQQLPDF